MKYFSTSGRMAQPPRGTWALRGITTPHGSRHLCYFCPFDAPGLYARPKSASRVDVQTSDGFISDHLCCSPDLPTRVSGDKAVIIHQDGSVIGDHRGSVASVVEESQQTRCDGSGHGREGLNGSAVLTCDSSSSRIPPPDEETSSSSSPHRQQRLPQQVGAVC